MERASKSWLLVVLWVLLVGCLSRSPVAEAVPLACPFIPVVAPPSVSPLKVLTAHTGGVGGLAFSPDGRTLASGGNDGLIKLWDAASRTLKKTLYPRGGDVWQLQFSTDGKTLIAALEEGLHPKVKPKDSFDESLFIAVWEVATGKVIRSFPLRGTEFTGLSLSPDGRLAAVCSNSFEQGPQATLWEVKSGRLLREMKTEEQGRYNVAFAQDNRTVAVGSLYKPLRLWDAKTGKVKVLGSSDMMLQFAPDGKTLVGMNENVTINIRSASTGKVLRELEGHDDTVWSFAFSPDGKTLASGGGDLNSEVRLWNLATGKRVATFQGHQKGVTSVAYSPDGRLLVSGGAEGTVRFWSMKSSGG